MLVKHTASTCCHTSIFQPRSGVLKLLKCLELKEHNLELVALVCKGTEPEYQIAPESSAMPPWLKATTPLRSIPWRKYSSLISPWCAKISDHQFPLCVLYPIQSIDFNGIFRIWNRFFPKWEFGGGGWSLAVLLESSQVKTVDLLKSHFGTELRKSFTLSAERL